MHLCTGVYVTLNCTLDRPDFGDSDFDIDNYQHCLSFAYLVISNLIRKTVIKNIILYFLNLENASNSYLIQRPGHICHMIRSIFDRDVHMQCNPTSSKYVIS